MDCARRFGGALLALLSAVGFWLLLRPARAPADGKVHIRYWEK